MNKKSLLVLSSLLLGTLVGCGSKSPSSNLESKNVEIVDSFNRTVVVPSKVNKVVCIGAGALRLYSYVGDMNKLAGVEKVDQDGTGIGGNLSFRPYKMANKDILNSLPTCGTGGPSSQVAEAEEILKCQPDVIFSLLSDVGANDTLQQQTNIPVVMLNYGTTRGFDEGIKNNLKLIGKIMGEETKANNLCTYIDGLISDLDTKTKDIKDENKPRLYLGCNSFYGTKSIESSAKNNPILNAAHIHNILDEETFATAGGDASNVDMEYLVSEKGQPDKMILDFGGLNILKNSYADNDKAAIYNSLNSFKNEEVYLQLPYNAYYTNIEIAYADAYFAAAVSYPDLYSITDVETKTREILKTFVGKDVYDDIKEITGGGFRKLDLASEFSNYKK